MNTQKVLVTGGMGYIGSHTVVCLIEQGYEVIIADSLVNSRMGTLEGIAEITGQRPRFYEMDLRDLAAIQELFQKEPGIQSVIHFAALKAVGESVEKPLDYYRNNLFSQLNLMTAMQENGVNNFIFSSSATVYGEPDQLPIRENATVKPATNPYGNTKQIGEDIIRDTAKANSEFKAISLRYFNPIGAHASAKIGELPLGKPNNLMPFITQTAAGIREELLVFGDDYPTPDGTAIRDYIHVVDLAEAHVKAVARLTGGKQKSNYEVFNLGTGNGFSVLEVIKSFEKMSGVSLKYRFVDRREGDVSATYSSPEYAQKELGWQAQKGIDEMTGSAWAWERELKKSERGNQKSEKR